MTERTQMALQDQKGEGRLSGIIWLVIFAAVAYGLWNVVPIYFTNFNLKDKMNQVARSPRGTNTDDALRDVLYKEVREESLDPYIQRSCFHITTLDTSRKITCSYERTQQVLPGINWTFRFNNEVDQPLIF
jgi:hypothetical protein